MKSLLTYINESIPTDPRFINESHSKYTNQLRKFLMGGYKFNDKVFIDPRVFYSVGTGTIDDLAPAESVRRIDTKDHKSTDPLMGVGEVDGKVYMVVYQNDNSKDLFIFSDISDSTSVHGYISISLLSDLMDYDRSHEKKPTHIYLNGTYRLNRHTNYLGLLDIKLELFSIDWKLYDKLYKKVIPTNIDVDELQGLLYKRGAIIRELTQWADEFIGKLKWYSAHNIGKKAISKGVLYEEISSFSNDLMKLSTLIKTSKQEGIPVPSKAIRQAHGFTNNFYNLIEDICGVRNKDIRIHTSSDPLIGNNFRRDALKTFEFLLDEPVVVSDGTSNRYRGIQDEAPSFRMETKCPTLLSLLEILYMAK